jgi:hypothetical protein
MKTKSQSLKWLLPAVMLPAGAVSSLLLTAEKTPAGYVVHEWGTFTSVQGADGSLLDWRPLESSRLPKFVYDWRKPGLARQPVAQLFPGKGAMLTLQRMETPVIYFYADKAQTVDVSVHFPHGLITEWYPQADQIGPSSVPAPRIVATLDNCAHHVGVKPAFSFASLLPNSGALDSQAHWARVEILPSLEQKSFAPFLLRDASGSHYFTARDTDANLLRLPARDTTNSMPQYEKFIFYRGVGNFSTPLLVTMESNDTLTLANEGSEPLAHLFVLTVENHTASYLYTAGLHPGERRRIQLNQERAQEPLKTVSTRLGAKLAESLEQEGLYAREANAMVNTWRDSWFEEDGVRVLYVLPRAWTDRTLPLAFDPSPSELTRVMVGRAEVLSPALERRLAGQLTKAEEGDSKAREELGAELRKLGRFAEPAFRLALQGTTSDKSQQAWTVFQSALKPADPTVF